MSEKLYMGLGRSFPAPLPNPEDYIVEFDGPDDPKHPYNWKFSVKYVDFDKTLEKYINISFRVEGWSSLSWSVPGHS